MKNKNDKNKLEEYLYKILKVNDNDSMIIIFALDTHIQSLLTVKGKPSKQLSYVIHYLDVTRSSFENSIVSDIFIIEDVNSFLTSVSIVDNKTEQQNILELSSKATVELTNLSHKLQQYNQILCTLTYINDLINPLVKEKSNKAGFVVTDGSSGLAEIVFKSINGDTASLTKEDVERMGGVIMDTVMHNLHLDVSSKENVKELLNQLEFKLMQSLPTKMSTEGLHINIDVIVNEIRKFQGEKRNEDNFGTGEFDITN